MDNRDIEELLESHPELVDFAMRRSGQKNRMLRDVIRGKIGSYDSGTANYKIDLLLRDYEQASDDPSWLLKTTYLRGLNYYDRYDAGRLNFKVRLLFTVFPEWENLSEAKDFARGSVRGVVSRKYNDPSVVLDQSTRVGDERTQSIYFNIVLSLVFLFGRDSAGLEATIAKHVNFLSKSGYPRAISEETIQRIRNAVSVIETIHKDLNSYKR